jgi:hypothetical protein
MNKHVVFVILCLITVMGLYWKSKTVRFTSIILIISVLLAYWIAYNYSRFYSDKFGQNGGWGGESQYLSHKFREDPGLAMGLYEFFKKSPNDSIIDLGCGNASYIEFLASKGVLNVKCIDTLESSKRNPKFIEHGDLSKPVHKMADWIISFEVGEHIPKKYESVFMENMTKNARKGIILSWAEVGHGGDGHVNEMEIDEVMKKITQYGFKLDMQATDFLRSSSNRKCYFKRNILVFLRA